MKKKPAHGDIRDLEKIGGGDFKKEMLDMTEKELRIQETMQAANKGHNPLTREDQKH